MLAGIFTSCFTAWAWKSGDPVLQVTVLLPPVWLALDVVTLPIQILIWVISDSPPWDWLSDKSETQTHLAKVEFNTITEYYSLVDKMNSLPETKLASLAMTLNSIPETERNTAKEKLISLPEEKINSLVKAYNSISVKEIIASIERINSLSKTELVSLLQSFCNLSEEEINTLLLNINNSLETENVVLVNNLSETNNVSMANSFNYLWKNDLKYYNMDMRLYLQY